MKTFKELLEAVIQPNGTDKVNEAHEVHVSDGSKYDEEPHEHDVKHVNDGVKKHGGKFAGHTDKGAIFSFGNKTDAENFRQHVNKSPKKTVHADHLDESLNDACWKGYEAIGTKKKNGKEVPNCVPVKECSDSEKAAAELKLKLTKAKNGQRAAKALGEENLDELNKSTLSSYAKKSHDQLMKHTSSVNFKQGRGDSDAFAYAHDKEAVRKTANRTKGLHTAINKLAKEEAEQQNEGILDRAKEKYHNVQANRYASKHAELSDTDKEKSKQYADKANQHKFKRQELTKKRTGSTSNYYEEVEQIDEISKDTLNSYVHKAFQHGNDLHYDIEHERDKNEKAKMKAKLDKRNTGVIRAAKKLNKEQSMLSFADHIKEATSPMQKLRDAHERHLQKALAANKAGDDEATKVHQQYMQKITAKMNKLKQNEEIDLTEMENLCEISKATLASYIPKAAQSARFAGMTAQDMANRSDRARNKSTKDSYHRLSMKYKNKAWDREDNIKKAAQKLAKEEVEQIDELSKDTLGNYIKRSSHDAALSARHGGSDPKELKNAIKRLKGIAKATNKLTQEAKDTVTKDKEGKVTSWSHEGDWKKSTGKNPEGKVHNLSDIARRKTEKLAKEEVVNEAIGTDHVNKDEKLKRAGAKPLSVVDKLKGIKHGFAAARKGESEDELKLYNKSKSTVKEDTDMITFKQLLENISEAAIDDLKDRLALKKANQSAYSKGYKPAEKSATTKVKGHSYGAGEEEGEDEEGTKKVSKPTEPEVKRGRGRPAGSKSGARN